MITLKYFARLRDVAGKGEELLDRDELTVAELLDWAESVYPGFGADNVQVAVNEEYALKEDTIRSGDVCAFIPPVSGG